MSYKKRKENRGFTLIEATIVLLLLTLAVIPIVKLATNSTVAGSGVYTTSSANKILTEEQAIANTIIQKVLSKNKTDPDIVNPLIDANNMHLGFNTSGSLVELDPTYGLPTATSPSLTTSIPTGTPSSPVSDPTNRKFTYPKYQYKTSNIYYQWVIYDASTQLVSSTYKRFVPAGNNLVKAVLNVYSGENASTSTVSKLSVSTYLFQNTTTGNIQVYQEKMGIIFVFDISGTMTGSSVESYTPGSLDQPPWTKDNQSGLPLGLTMSANEFAHNDEYSMAAPYLVYRAGLNDLFYGAKDDDSPITPYDERYDPCSTASFPYATTGTLGTTTCDLITKDSTLADIAPSFTDTSKFFRLPSRPIYDYPASFNHFPSDNYYYFDKECIDKDLLSSSTCTNMSSPVSYPRSYPPFPDFPSTWQNKRTDVHYANMYRAFAFASNGDDNILKYTLSRMEASRTAMLSLVETVETDPSLVKNFRFGFVSFSDYAASSTLYPYARSPLDKSDGSGQFATLKNTLFMINRACKYDTTNDNTSVVCPSGKQPILPQDSTNISDGLYTAKDMFDSYESSTGEVFSKKLIILLTDGQPTKGVKTPAGMHALAQNFAADGVNIYSIGLLISGNTAAQDVLNAIKSADSDNTTVFVNSFGDLTSVFENIAQEAEAYMLTQIQERYGFLDP